MNRIGFVMLYTPDVPAKIAFYERAFGVTQKFLADSGGYGEVAAGDSSLGFVQEDFMRAAGMEFSPSRRDAPPAGLEIALVTDDVDAAYRRAVDAGCAPLKAPEDKPWGQRVGVVRDDDGVLVEICTPWST